MPVTVAHDVIAEHPILCGCSACSAYPVALRRRLKRQSCRTPSATTVSS